MWAIVVRMV